MPKETNARVMKAYKNKKYQLSIGNLDLSFRIWSHMNQLRKDMLNEIDVLKAQQAEKLDIQFNATDENGVKYHNPNVGRLVPNNMPMK
jgi:ABC-type histidine transport system ATPase subunit